MPQIALIVDADDLERRRLARLLSRAGFDVIEAAAPIEGLFETLEHDPDIILLAEEVPPLVAGDLLSVLRRLTSAPIIIIGSGGEPAEIASLDLGADYYQSRPCSDRVLVARARALLRWHRGSTRSGVSGALAAPRPAAVESEPGAARHDVISFTSFASGRGVRAAPAASALQAAG